MTLSEDEVFHRVSRALRAFYASDADLLHRNASERSIAHKLAEHLQDQFPEYKVDCEYNRHVDSVKRQPQDDVAAAGRGRRGAVLPDIVVHERGTDEQNVLVIEIKKSSSRRSHDGDVKKLCLFTGSKFGYAVGIFIVIDVARRRVGGVCVFKDGDKVEGDTVWCDLKEICSVA